jgi:serine/threonine protein kinase
MKKSLIVTKRQGLNKTKAKQKNKTRKIGGSTIYDGSADRIIDQIKKTDDTYDGKPFFRKLYPKKRKGNDTRHIEKQIVEILMNNPHPNIVTFYDVNYRYLDMEELDSPHSNTEFYDNFKDETQIIIKVMIDVKDFLQKLGIMYIDWKFDNIAKGKDGNYKLFDFDASGIVDLHTNKWKVKPPPNYWSFMTAKKRHCNTPKEIDDWSFRYNILNEEELSCSK